MTPLADLQHFPLAHAFLCENCLVVGNCSTRCPACASEISLAPLVSYLNRTIGLSEVPGVDDPH